MTTYICAPNDAGAKPSIVTLGSFNIGVVSSDNFLCSPFNALDGVDSISGMATVHGAGSTAAYAVLLGEGSAFPLAVARCAMDGSYHFRRVPIGNYAICVIDTEGNYRGKVIHTVCKGPMPTISGTLPVASATVAYSGKLSGYAYQGTWSLGAGAPAWATINTSTGEITGVPAAGTYVFDVVLTDIFGRAVTSTQSVYVDPDPLYKYNRVYLKLNGADGSTSIADEMGNTTWTAMNGANIQSNELYLDGVDDYVVADYLDAVWNPDTDPFTMEMYITPSVVPSRDVYFSEGWTGSVSVMFALMASAGSGDTAGARPCFGYYTPSTGWFTCSSPDALVANVKVHLAAERIKGAPNDTINLYVGGVVKASMSIATGTAWPVGNDPIYLGRRWDNTAAPVYARAKIDMFRYTVGVNRYGGAFTPPTP